MRILIIENESILAKRISDKFAGSKYAVDIERDGEAGLDCALSDIYDIIIMDTALSKLDGFEVLDRLRTEKIPAPVIMLSSRDDVGDKIRALDMGADDYMVKPIVIDELAARTRAVLRRKGNTPSGEMLSFGDVSLDMSTYEMRCNDNAVRLSTKEIQIFELLLSHGKNILQKDELILKVWGYDSDAEYNNAEVFITYLRRKLSSVGSRVKIMTVRGIGYRLE